MKQKITFLIVGLLISLTNTNAQLWEQISKTLTTYDDAESYSYGYSVSIDGSYAVISAYGYNNYQGIAYVLHYSEGNWETMAELTASDAEEADYFGNSVSISGQTVVVGAYYEDANNLLTSGSAYVYTMPDGGWENMTQTAKLTASGAKANDFFGWSVSVDGDIIVVGARSANNDIMGNECGAAYVFEKPETGWSNMTQTAKLSASDGARSDFLGHRVSVDGDVVVVSACGHDEGGNDENGAAYVFEKPETGWEDMTQNAKLTASNGAEDLDFGQSVDIDNNVIVVGAVGYSSKWYLSDVGAAYVFAKPETGWNDMTQTALLTASDGDDEDVLGVSVSISDEIIVVGSSGDESMTGAAYVYAKPASGWGDMTENSKITASDAAKYDRFSSSVSINGDSVLVGAYANDDNGSSSGSAYFYNLLPEINIKQGDTDIASKGSYDFGEVVTTSNSGAITFTIENKGLADLTLLGNPMVEISGTNADDFTIAQSETIANIGVNDSTTFTITFAPSETGERTAAISIANSDSINTITLTGTGMLAQSISFETMVDKTYGDEDSTLSATASSGLDVVFTSSDESVATCSGTNGTTLTIVGAGTCSIYANQSGNETYSAATQEVQSIRVLQAELKVTADNQNMTKGDDVPTLTLVYDGFVNDDSESDLYQTPTTATIATSNSETGGYDITVSGGSDTNYSFIYQSGTLLITQPIVTAMQDCSSESISTYPNPVSTTINITGSTGVAQIFKLSGHMQLTHNLSQSTSIDVSDLPNGVYFLRIDGEVIKVIKE